MYSPKTPGARARAGLLALAACAAVAFCIPAGAAVPRGKQYLQALKQYRVPFVKSESGPIVTGETGEAYEIRGTLSGLATQSDGYTLLVKTADGGSLFASGAGEQPDIPMGTAIRVLLKDTVSESGTQLAQILMVATDAEVELSVPPPAPAKPAKAKPAAKTSARAKRKPLASRGMGLRRTTPVVAASSTEVFNAYKRAIRYFNPKLSEAQLNAITNAILGYSIQYGVDARLVMAVVAVESNFRTDATSRAGAMGLGQLMPGTARGLGVSNAYDPIQNLEGSIRLIRGHLDSHAGKDAARQLALALASYNAGPGAVRKYGGVPPYRETRNYIAKVAAWYRHFLGED